MKRLLLLAMVGIVLTGCKTIEYVPVIEHKTDTLIQTKHQRDSVWLHDSITISEKGDTVRIEKWHTKYIERDVHDTTYVAKTDSVPKPYPVTEYVEKPLSWLQKTLIGAGSISILSLLVIIVIKIRKFLP